MIRRLQKTDIDAVAQIWLTSNREAHDFVPQSIGKVILHQ